MIFSKTFKKSVILSNISNYKLLYKSDAREIIQPNIITNHWYIILFLYIFIFDIYIYIYVYAEKIGIFSILHIFGVIQGFRSFFFILYVTVLFLI